MKGALIVKVLDIKFLLASEMLTTPGNSKNDLLDFLRNSHFVASKINMQVINLHVVLIVIYRCSFFFP